MRWVFVVPRIINVLMVFLYLLTGLVGIQNKNLKGLPLETQNKQRTKIRDSVL